MLRCRGDCVTPAAHTKLESKEKADRENVLDLVDEVRAKDPRGQWFDAPIDSEVLDDGAKGADKGDAAQCDEVNCQWVWEAIQHDGVLAPGSEVRREVGDKSRVVCADMRAVHQMG